MSFTRFIIFLALIISLAVNTQTCFALDPATTGVVLLHGKGGDTESLHSINDALTTAGFHTETPLLPWSASRNYDQPYQKADADITSAISRLRAKGASRIVLAGHSMGGNAALHKATSDKKLAAVVLLAPAFFPEGDTALKLSGDSVAKAKEIIRTKNVNQTSEFVEVPSGKTVQLPAAIYLSYYDPSGPAAMSLFAPRISDHV